MHFFCAVLPCLRVNLPEREWWIDLPELTSIRLGELAFRFNHANGSNELIMRSDDDEMKWFIDLPKLTSLTTVNGSSSFLHARSITLEGYSYHSTITNRHALSHHCCSLQGICFFMEENPSHQESFSLPSLIPRHHSRSPTVSLVHCFFHTHFHIHVQINQS